MAQWRTGEDHTPVAGRAKEIVPFETDSRRAHRMIHRLHREALLPKDRPFCVRYRFTIESLTVDGRDNVS